jgi:ABC-type multidrug transport system ATPase subunit/pSer/pThr/pTyr-binding forkhead associated (FHA) protein
VGNQVAQKPHAAPPLLVRTRRSDHRLESGTEYRIGRDPAADIVLDDARVSWRHATLRADGQSWVLEDLGSTNGTWVGPERTNRVEIRSNCVVRLGNPDDGAVLRFEPQQPPPEPVRAPAPDPQVSMAHLPSVDRRPTSRMPLPVKVMRIGRTPENDLVVSDLGVSRKHAELRKSQSGRYQIIDLGSHNGTFVNGSRLDGPVELTEDDIVSIGHSTFRLTNDELREYVDEGGVSFEARELKVQVQGNKILLDNVSFPIEECFLVGVIGPSGAGKSTLLNALTGMRPADTGTVLYDNRDLYRDYAELRHRIGLVPQKDIMHTQLTPRTALGYAAELRFPSDTHKEERTKRVDEVLTELSLTHRADVRAENLSGGQLKRVNVALELLTRPSLLFLDEPTSGLDPGLDAQVMEQMRDLAHDGRTIIVVTHSVENLNTCDRLLVLVPGGKIAYYGPPQDGLTYFGKPRWADVFRAFDSEPGRDWAAEFRASKEFTRYVTNPLTPRPALPTAPEQAGDRLPPAPPPRRRGRIRQLSTLARRYLRVIAADRFYLGSIIALPIILGVLVRLLSPAEGLSGAPGSNNGAQTMLMVLMIMACLAGVVNAVREVVKERSIYIRERAAGLSAGAYLLSKVMVLGVIAVLQAVVMTAIGVLGHPLPPSGSFLTGAPLLELVLAVAFLEFASTCLGLLVSCMVSSSDKAMQAIVLVTMIQFVFSGGIISLAGKVGLEQIAALAPARWGMAALASTVNLNVLNPPGSKPDPLWKHTPGAWLISMGAMLVLSAVYLLIAWWQLNRLSPGRRK